MKHTFSGLCRGGPLDGQSLEHHQNVYRIFEPPSYELLGEYWHQDGQWAWHPSEELRAAMSMARPRRDQAKYSKLANCSLRFTGGSLKASTRSI